jgi:hypothetical protein
MTVTVYTFEDGDGDEYGSFTTQDYAEAKAYAQDNRLCVIANEFEWADSHPLDDYTPRKKRSRPFGRGKATV